MFNRASLLILTLTGALTLAACGGSKHQTTYVTTPLNDGVTAFRLNTNTGEMKQILGSPYSTGISPSAIRLHPSGKFAYVSNAGENTIAIYQIDSSGALKEVTPRTNTGKQPSDLLMDPGGNFLYAVNSADNTISAYSITASSGALQLTSTSPFPTSGFTPLRGAITPSGKFFYVANSNSGTVSGFAVDSSGALALVPHSPTAVGNGPIFITIDQTGKFLYVANLQDGTYSGFMIDGSTGELSAMSGSPFGVANTATTIVPVSSVAVDSTSKYVYVTTLTTGNNVYGYSIDGTTGVPGTVVSGSPFASGDKPGFIVSDASGTLIFVGNQSSNSLSGFKITASSGVLTLVSTTSTGSAPTSIAFAK